MNKLFFFTTFLLSASFVVSVPSGTFAAVVSFDPQETTVGLETPFLVGLTIDADRPVNAINIVIDMPEGMDVLDASDGDSVINAWVERPHLTDARQIVFSGIIPGGFEGLRGKLITLKVSAQREGRFTFGISPSSRMYENTPNAAGQAISSQPLELSVVRGKDNLVNRIPDMAPPEVFVPVIVAISDNAGAAQWAVSFQAQDKGSGIDRYEVAESPRGIRDMSEASSRKLSWNEAVAPYALADQHLSSFVYVRAIDKAGNIRYAHLEPLHAQPWHESPGSYILIGLVILALFYALSKRFHIKIYSRK